MKRLGVEFPLQSDKVREVIKNKYGYQNFLCSDAGKRKMIELYDFPHAMQNKEIFEKAMRNAFRMKDVILPSGKVLKVQGYEPIAIMELLEAGIPGYGEIEEEDIKVGIDVPSICYSFEGVDRVYHPDIYIEKYDILIEIKSTWTFQMDRKKNVKKFQTACTEHNFQVWIYDGKLNREVRDFVEAKLIFR